jgi:hypothetical protein
MVLIIGSLGSILADSKEQAFDFVLVVLLDKVLPSKARQLFSIMPFSLCRDKAKLKWSSSVGMLMD